MRMCSVRPVAESCQAAASTLQRLSGKSVGRERFSLAANGVGGEGRGEVVRGTKFVLLHPPSPVSYPTGRGFPQLCVLVFCRPPVKSQRINFCGFQSSALILSRTKPASGSSMAASSNNCFASAVRPLPIKASAWAQVAKSRFILCLGKSPPSRSTLKG